MDTDCIVTSKKLSPEFIDEYQLGRWKLEHEIERGIFLAPKMYWMKIK